MRRNVHGATGADNDTYHESDLTHNHTHSRSGTLWLVLGSLSVMCDQVPERVYGDGSFCQPIFFRRKQLIPLFNSLSLLSFSFGDVWYHFHISWASTSPKYDFNFPFASCIWTRQHYLFNLKILYYDIVLQLKYMDCFVLLVALGYGVLQSKLPLCSSFRLKVILFYSYLLLSLLPTRKSNLGISMYHPPST